MTAYAFAPAGLECFICKDDAPTDGSTMVEVSMLAHELGIAVAVCPVCTTRALAEDVTLSTLVTDIREQYHQQAAPAPKPGIVPPNQLALTPRPIRNAGRRHPVHGARLAANPPEADVDLHVLLGWEHEKLVSEPKLLIMPNDNPERLRFDVAANRAARVIHPPHADRLRLLSLAQGLIDYGARQVELVIHPLSPEGNGIKPFRIVPRGGCMRTQTNPFIRQDAQLHEIEQTVVDAVVEAIHER